MKKLFHRKKHDEADSSPNQRSPYSDRSDPALRTSLYDSTPAGGLPQTGDYPIKGNDTANVLKKKPSHKSSIRSWRSSSSSQQPALFNRSPTPDQYGGRGMSNSWPNSNAVDSQTYAPQPGVSKRRSRTQLPQDISNMNLGNEGPTFRTTTTTTTTGSLTTLHNSHGLPSESGALPQSPPQTQPQHQGNANANASSIRPVNPSDLQGAYSGNQPQTQPRSRYAATPSAVQGAYTSNESPVSPLDHRSKYSANSYGKQSRQRESDGAAPVNSASIPRKEVGAGSARTSADYSAPSHVLTGHNRETSSDKALPSAPTLSRNGYTPRQTEPAPVPAPAASSIFDRNRPISKGETASEAQAVVDRAKTGTKDTSIVEKYAPAVVHETVHKDVHHIREELIRREIHTHDVYHRMLPVIDVEVLPARHFLPVEGGGLVEISADEVPGRGNNWVLAETVSKIPSDQAAPRGARNFTARKFRGHEGDEVRYTTPEGHEKTEQTWVHPPELQTGARDTGQSWPMVLGEEALGKGTYGDKSPKSSKTRSSKYAGTSSGTTRE